jgi:hypothetical protein
MIKLCKEGKNDYCTCFPEYWIKYKWRGFKKLPFEKVYIGWMCKKHDDGCATHTFYRDLWNERIVGAVAIATVATLACWWKYTKTMWRKI